jgi:4-hydroxy-tetrahydrodipicolinate synthase
VAPVPIPTLPDEKNLAISTAPLFPPKNFICVAALPFPLVACISKKPVVAPLPIILYNVPGRTGSNMLPETTLKLAREIENIVAIKEASGNIDQCMKLVKNKPKEFIVLSGDDNLVVSQMAIGVEGCISVIGNLLPEEFSKMIHQCLNNEYDAARLTQLKLLEIIDLIFEEGNPVGIKTALHLQNICLDSVRLPLVKGSATLRERIKKSMIQI